MDQTRTFLLGQMAAAKSLQDYHLAFLALQRLEQLLEQQNEAHRLQVAAKEQGLGVSYDPRMTYPGTFDGPKNVARTRPASRPSEPYRAFVAQPLPPEFTRPVPQVRDDVAPDFDSIEVPGEEFTYNP